MTTKPLTISCCAPSSREREREHGGSPSWYDICLVLLTCLFIVFAYVFVFTNDDAFNSDHIEGTLWALASSEAGTPLSPDFYYAYAIPFGGNLFILPFVKLMGPCIMANRCGMAVFLTILLATLFYLASGLYKYIDTICIFVCAFMGLFATLCGHNIVSHVIYYGLAMIVACGILGSLTRIVARGSEKRSTQSRKVAYGLLVFFCIWGGSNGLPSIALGIMPAAIALVLACLKKRTKLLTRAWKPFLCCVVGSCAGIALYNLVTVGININGYNSNVGTYSLASIDEIYQNAMHLWWGWSYNFSIGGFLGATLCVFATITPIAFLAFWKKFNTKEKVVFLAFLITLLICLGECLLSKRGVTEQFTSFPRLLFNAYMMDFLVVGILAANTKSRLRRRTKANSVSNTTDRIFCVTIASYLCLTTAALAVTVGYSSYTETKIQTENTISELQNEGLSKGYATYWQSGVLTVASGGSIEVATVGLDSLSETGIADFRYNTLGRFYDEPSEGEDFFLLLTDVEYESVGGSESVLVAQSRSISTIDGAVLLRFASEDWDWVVGR